MPTVGKTLSLSFCALCCLLAGSIFADEFDLKTDPRLGQLVSGRFLHPTAKELLDSLRQQTGLNLALDPSVIHDRSIQGQTVFKDVSARLVMKQLANNKYIKGSWKKVGDGYELVATYKGPPPAKVPPIPLEIQKKLGFEPAQEKKERKLDWRTPRLIVLWAVLIASLCVLLWIRIRKRRFKEAVLPPVR